MTTRRWVACASLAVVLTFGAIVMSSCSEIAPQPTRTATPTDWDMSGSAMEQAYENFVTGLAEKYGLDSPIEADLVRWVDLHEWSTVQANCLSEHGFSVEPNPQGGINWGEIPPEQAQAQRLAAAQCEARYPIDPRFNMQLPLRRAENQYAFLVETQMPCVERAGYVVSAPPSKQTWLEQYYTTGSAWDPFVEAAEQSGPGTEGLDSLYQACPPTSDAVYPPLGVD